MKQIHVPQAWNDPWYNLSNAKGTRDLLHGM
jgi:hypothetical protein